MRFLPKGLNIPDELLEERDRGNVVFLCGAGVSYSAGMPNFLGLARHVVETLGAPSDAPSRSMLAMWEDKNIPPGGLPPLDQIFNLLQQEYTASEIDDLIAKRLKTEPGMCLSAHETILRLSKNADGKLQIVTTNFDLLFEDATSGDLETYVPPALPDLASGQPLTGLVYLHGRIDPGMRRGEGRHGFVVSSSDFGRAYLAEGWATRFVRDLLEQYTVVLLGYSANDPPVRYLLQGLHTRGHRSHTRILAFDGGTEEEVQPRWRDSGVRVLAYPAKGDDHSALWDTLSAWADRADDPPAWRQQVIDLARKGPRNLAPHERGQVASLVRTDIGARLFADADPPPTGEWLCVFDPNARYGNFRRSFDRSEPNFDPQREYGLDDDPPRPPENWPQTDPRGDDLLSLRSTDHRTNEFARLAGKNRFQEAYSLPPRLSQLIRWIVKVVHEPVVPWWAAKYSALHPELLVQIEQRVEDAYKELPPLARSTWRLLIDKFGRVPDDDDGYSRDWYKTHQRIQTEGWTTSVFRAFERSAAPYLRTKSPLGLDGSQPPSGDWSEIRQSHITEFEVAFPITYPELPETPDDVLPAVYQVLRRHLEMAAGLLSDIGPGYWMTSTFYPEDNPGEACIGEESTYLFQFQDLFDRMLKAHPELLQADTVLWPKEERFFFDKLHLYAWSFGVLFSGDEVEDALLSLSDKAFWSALYRRELLHLLRLRWHELPADKRKLLERRLVDGRAKHKHESEGEYTRDRSYISAIILGWLMNHGCELSEATQDVLPTLRDTNPRWSPERDEIPDNSYVQLGDVQIDADPSSIIDAPLDQIIHLAIKHTGYSGFIEYKPFDGLVKQRPARAVSALTDAARRGDYPVEFWRSAIRFWSDGARLRLVWLFAARLARLPAKIVVELRHELFGWLQEHLPKMVAQDQYGALSILDALLNSLFEGGAEVTESGIGNVAGEPRNRSCTTLSQALRQPGRQGDRIAS